MELVDDANDFRAQATHSRCLMKFDKNGKVKEVVRDREGRWLSE